MKSKLSSQPYLQALEKLSLEAGLVHSDEQLMQGALYLEMLNKWNKAFNLTAISGEQAMVRSHWLDSLSISPYIQGEQIVDVGTGAGLPGIPLAVHHPNKHFCLTDSNSKRQLFLEQVIHRLKLTNVRLHCGRVEHYDSDNKFDCVLSRAFKSLPEFLELTKSLLKPDGIFLAMKGVIDDEEIKKIPQDFMVVDVIPLATIETEKQRHLVVVKHKQAT